MSTVDVYQHSLQQSEPKELNARKFSAESCLELREVSEQVMSGS